MVHKQGICAGSDCELDNVVENKDGERNGGIDSIEYPSEFLDASSSYSE